MPLFPPVRPKKLNQARIDWRLAEFRRAVWVRGQQVTWEIAARCPCHQTVLNDDTRLDENLGHSRAACPECKGSGTIYHSAQQTQMMVAALSRSPKAFEIWGQSVHGGCAITALPENRPNFLDRITMTQTVMPYHEVRTRRAETEQPRYPIVTRAMQTADPLDDTEPVDSTIGVLYARRADGTGRVNGAEMVEGTDYAVNADGTVTWLAGPNAPLLGDPYTISYYAHPRYVVHEMGYSARDTFVAFKQETEVFRENVTAVTTAWLEILGVPGWPADGVG
jgi:hypothetical protein